MTKAALVFLMTAFVDAAWAAYVQALADRRHFVASLLSMVLVVTGGLSAIIYVAQPELLIAGALGAFVGTYAASWHGRLK